MTKRIHILASGRVQGVFFRASAKRVADTHTLTGFARNLPSGQVEIVAEGGESGLRALLDWCYRGSLLANVDGLSFDWQDATEEFETFQVSRNDGSLIVDQVHAMTNLGRRVLNKVDRKVEAVVHKTPQHVVIIPDGNRHWAKEHGEPFWKGYQEGMERIKDLLRIGTELGIPHMTVWGFSTENWSRPDEEVNWLMKAFSESIKDLKKELIRNTTSFRHLGRKDRLSSELRAELLKLEQETAHFTDKTFSMAVDYGGRDEIVRAVQKASKEGIVDDASLSKALDTFGLPDPDLIIRTSGEQRLSGIMPWQGVYAELYFTPLHFPDFTADQFRLALADYAGRQRRFGK